MSKRIEWIDYAKGFTILLVILHHSMLSVDFSKTSFLFSIIINHLLGLAVATSIMPVFFAISGYLYKDVTNFKEYIVLIYKKISSFFIPYFFIGILFLLVNNNFAYILLFKILLIPIEHTWFLYSLFLTFVIWGMMDLLKLKLAIKSLIIMILFIISKFIPIVLLGVPHGMPGLQRAFIFMPYFLLGYILRKNRNIEQLLFSNRIRSTVVYISSTFILLFVALIFHLDSFNSNFGYINFIPKVLLVIVLFRIFAIFPKNKLYKFMEYNGENSLIIYLVHYFTAYFICIKVQVMLGTNNLTALISIVAAFIVSYSISLLVIILCNYKAVRWIFFPREFIDPVVKRTKFGKWMFS